MACLNKASKSALVFQTNEPFVGNIQNDILLSTSNYLNSPVNNSLITDKHLICLEGNLIHVDQTSRVASGHIDTCLFVVLEFSDKTCISFHINGMLSNNSVFSNYVLKKITYPVEPTSVFSYLNENFPEKMVTLNKIYLIGILDSYFLSDAINGFEWLNFDESKSIDTMDDLTILSIIKRKLNIPIEKTVELVKKKSPGDYIYAGNTLYEMKIEKK